MTGKQMLFQLISDLTINLKECEHMTDYDGYIVVDENNTIIVNHVDLRLSIRFAFNKQDNITNYEIRIEQKRNAIINSYDGAHI